MTCGTGSVVFRDQGLIPEDDSISPTFHAVSIPGIPLPQDSTKEPRGWGADRVEEADNLKLLRTFTKKMAHAKARLWTGLLLLCRVRSTAGSSRLKNDYFAEM